MFDVNLAKVQIRRRFPNSKIEKIGDYKELFLFCLTLDTPGEENYDPFFSVNKTTGKVEEFSILTDGDIDEIMLAFEKGV